MYSYRFNLYNSCLVQWNEQYEIKVSSCGSMLYSNVVKHSVYECILVWECHLRCTFFVLYQYVPTVYFGTNLLVRHVKFLFSRLWLIYCTWTCTLIVLYVYSNGTVGSSLPPAAIVPVCTDCVQGRETGSNPNKMYGYCYIIHSM